MTEVRVQIDPLHSLFHKRKPTLDVSQFTTEYSEDGFDPLKHFKSINFNYDIKSIILEQFKDKEQITNDVMRSYFKLTPKKINHFNHFIDDQLTGFRKIPYTDKLKQIL